MRYYIDSDIFIFFARDGKNLTGEVRRILDDYENHIYISAESVKEVINLFQCGKVSAKWWKNAQDIITFIDDVANFEIKPVKKEHLRVLADLPMYEDHRDPFDRMIIAHAITEKIPIISSDTNFPRYGKYGLELIINDY